jgi:hypothetical protein
LETEPEVTGIVFVNRRWEFGTVGEHVSDNLFKIMYEGPSGNTKSVVRDIKDESVWREGVDVIPGDDEVAKPKEAKAPKQKKATAPAPKRDPHEIVHYKTGDAKRGKNKFPADAKFHTCTGVCGLRKPAKAFPTIAGTGLRVSECRACRDTRRGAEAAAAAVE